MTAPPLGGLCSYASAARTHGSVEEAVRLLRRLARIERRTLLVLAAHLNAVPEWEVKCALSLLCQRIGSPHVLLDRSDSQSVPHELSFASYPNTTLEPRERYALLYRAEHAVMGRGPGGKPAQHSAARASGDALATLFQDYDWADEVLHVHIGRRVLAQVYDTVDERDEAGTHAWHEYERILVEDQALDRSDWWDEFYADVAEQS
jgi:hypothetical protein